MALDDQERAATPRYRLFGGVAAAVAGHEVDLGGAKQRAVLAMLLLDVGRQVPVERIIDAVWDGRPPARAEVSVRGYVSNLRKALGGGSARIRWRDGTYQLTATAAELDTGRFESLVTAGQRAWRAGELGAARAQLSEAIALWADEPFGGLVALSSFRDAATGLLARRREAEDALVDVRLALGEHDELIGHLGAAVAAEPLWERRRAQLALALYRAGRAVEALRCIGEARRLLAEEVGVVPGPELVELEAMILGHDERLAWRPPAPAPVSAAAAAALPSATDELDGPPFVGRDRPLGALLGAWDAGDSGGRIVVISGEAGIGKTRMVNEALSRRGATGSTRWGRCNESTMTAPLRPWKAVAAQLAAAGNPLLDAALTAHSGAAVDPTAGRLSVHGAVLGALRGSARQVVVLDDLQWADEASLALLELLADDLPAVPLLLIVTLRTPLVEPSTALVDCLGSLARSRAFHRIELSGLVEADIGEWIGATIEGRELGAVARFVHERTDGNAFFAQEVIALLAADGRSDVALELTVPSSVQDVIRRRTSRLPPTTQRVLSAAAVLGRSFDADLVAGMLTATVQDALDALTAALDAGIVTAEPGRPGRFAFTHVLVADTLVLEQNAVRLARLHAAAAQAVEALRPPDEAAVEAIAHHAYAGATAGTAMTAVEYSTRAAAMARASFAHGLAATHLERAVHALSLTSRPDDRRRLVLLTDLGIARGRAGDIAGARAALADAAQLAERLGDLTAMIMALTHVNIDDFWSSLDWAQVDARTVDSIDRALEANGPEDSAARAGLLAAKAAQLYYLDSPGELEALSAEAVAVASRIGDPLTLARVLVQRYWATWRPSGNAARTETAAALVALGQGGAVPPSFVPLAHLARFTAAYEVGDAEVFDRSLAEARAAADPVRTPSAWSYVLYAEVSVLLLRGLFEEAEDKIAEVHEAFWRTRRVVADIVRAALLAQVRTEQAATSDALGLLECFADTAYSRSMAWLRAWVLAEGGRPEEAAAQLRAFDGPLPDDWYRVVVLTAAIHAAAEVGDEPFLRRHLEPLRPLAGLVACAGSGGVVLGPVSLGLARGEHALGHHDLAIGYLEAALSQAQALGAVPWIARCLTMRHRLTGDGKDRRTALELAERTGLRALAAQLRHPSRR